MSRLVKRGHIVCVRKGVYRLAAREEWPAADPTGPSGTSVTSGAVDAAIPGSIAATC
ncbi:hypothetical protein ABZ390_17705 [Streptomyces solisilvae]